MKINEFVKGFPQDSYIKQIWDTKFPANRKFIKDILSQLANVPKEHLHEFLQRLQAKKKGEFWTATAELFFISYFTSKKYSIEVHPKLKDVKTRPEMKLIGQESEFILEVKTLFEEESDQNTYRTLDNIVASAKRKINNDLPYHISIHVNSDLPANYKYSSVVKKIVDLVDQYKNKNQPGRERLKDIEIEGVRFNITINQIDSRGLSFGFGRDQSINSQAKIKKIIRDKVLKYGKLNLPFVLVIDSKDFTKFGRHQIENALFGLQTISWKINTIDGSPVRNEPSITSRDNSGILKYNRLTRLSVIVYHSFSLSDSGNIHTIRVYLNPYASYPLGQKVFLGYPQFVSVETGNGNGYLKWIDDEGES